MIKKSLLTASLLLPLIALSGVAYAGGPRTPTAFQNAAQTSVSKPYAQAVAPVQVNKPQWTYQGGPKGARFIGR